MTYSARNLCIGALGIFLLTGCASEVTLSVPDMMCEESCAVKVHDVLAKQDGVREVSVDFPHRTATLSVSNSRFDVKSAIAALVDHGFEEAHLAVANTSKLQHASSAAAADVTAPSQEPEVTAAESR